MALASAVATATRPSQVITWTDDSGAALNLTGATITGKIRDRAKTVRSITGTLNVTDAVGGIFTWVYSAADVATAGEFTVQFTAAFGSAPTPARTIVDKWFVYEVIA